MKRLRTALLLTLPLLLVPACALTGANRSAATVQDFVYVTNQSNGTVTVINANTLEIEATVDLTQLGFDQNTKPHHVAVEPDGSFWYVTLITGGKVLKFNADNDLVGQAEFEVAGLLALDPSSNNLFVGRSMAAVNPPQRIGMIDRTSMEIEELDVFIPRPHAIAVSKDGRKVYAGSLAENRFTTVDLDSGDLTFTDVDDGGNLHHMFVDFAISPDGKTMITGGQMSGKLMFFDATASAELPMEKMIDVNDQPWHPVFSADGKYAYFANKTANSLTEVDMKTREVSRVVEGEGFNQPHGAAISPDGRYVFVSNNNLDNSRPSATNPNSFPGTVTVVDRASFEVVKVIEVGPYASGIATRQSN